MDSIRYANSRLISLMGVTLVAVVVMHGLQIHLHLIHAEHSTFAHQDHHSEIHLCSFACDEQRFDGSHVVDFDGTWLSDSSSKSKLSFITVPAIVATSDLTSVRFSLEEYLMAHEPQCSDHSTPHRRAPPLA